MRHGFGAPHWLLDCMRVYSAMLVILLLLFGQKPAQAAEIVFADVTKEAGLGEPVPVKCPKIHAFVAAEVTSYAAERDAEPRPPHRPATGAFSVRHDVRTTRFFQSDWFLD